MTKCYLGILTALVLTLGIMAQEQQSQPAENSDSGNSSRRNGRSRGSRGDFGGGSGGFEQMRERIRQADAQIKEKFPEEYKELEKLDSTDRRAAYQKRVELARKAGIELPDFGRGRGDRRPGGSETQNNQQEEWQKAEEAVKAKFPDEYAEIAKLRETDAAAALLKLRELAEKAGVKLPEGEPPAKEVGVRNIARLAIEQANRILERRYPDEYAEIVKLRETDPDLARDKYRELFKRAGLSSEELKKRVVAHAAGTRIVQVEAPQNSNNTGNANSSSNTSRRGNWTRGNFGGMGAPPDGNGGPPGGGW